MVRCARLVCLGGLALVAFGTAAWGSLAGAQPPSGAKCTTLDPAHKAWTRILAAHVQGGLVDYASVKAKSRDALEAYVEALARLCPRDYAALSSPDKLAYWLNAYNAYTVKLIVDHYPIASIRKIGGGDSDAFKRKWIPLAHELGRSPISLDELENEIVRKRWSEPRIHFALVCAATSCPPLRREAYRGKDLETQLEEQTKAFLRDPTKNRFDAATGTLYLSQIFEWFAGDFVTKSGSVKTFIAPYFGAHSGAVTWPTAKVVHLEYDWSLNAR